MKKILILLCCTVTAIFYGCKANYPVAQESGKENIAYLIFVSASDLKDTEVNVDIDNGTKFKAKTVKQKKSNRRGTQYSVQTGKRKVTVTLDGKTLYNKYVFLSPQETKIITLP
ncbi:hypothetical protein [Xylanibacter rarus]|jgi:predicted transcriptional regulator|uniref:hypothetical protein n=1 Tax=Xylanibacter rarus TaxID=1676614 RepID=UPI002AB13DC8|nr:hypothetical protein [Prevotellaceae bacterium]